MAKPVPARKKTGTQENDGPLQTIHLVACVVAAVVCTLAYHWENLAYYRHLDTIPDIHMQSVSSLQTENGFYYSFYREMTDRNFFKGLARVIYDTRSEYPDTLNAIRRFNIYQEVLLAIAYHILRMVGCYWVSPWGLFKFTVVAINSLGYFALCLLSTEMSGSVVTAAGFACIALLNRFQIGRLGNYTSANLREIWALPVLWLQILCLWKLLACPLWRPRLTRCVWLSSTFAFLVLWQFSPFLLLLQATAVYFAYLVCGYRQIRMQANEIFSGYLATVLLASLVQFASPYLLTSPFFFQLVAIKVGMWIMRSCRLEEWGDQCPPESAPRYTFVAAWIRRRVIAVVEGLVSIFFFLLIREIFARMEWSTADTHVYEILCTKVKVINDVLPEFAKLPSSRIPKCAEPSFNAKLYLVMGVFKEIEAKSLETFSTTAASMFTVMTCCVIVFRFLASSTKLQRLTAPVVSPQSGKEETSQDATTSKGTSTSRGKPVDAPGLRQRKNNKGDDAPAAGSQKKTESAGAAKSGLAEWNDEDAALMVMALQFALFFFLGCLINRMRAAFGPLMMVMASICFGFNVWRHKRWVSKARAPIAWGLLLIAQLAQVAWLSNKLPCISDSEGICYHFEERSTKNGDTIDLIDWMNRNLDPKLAVLCSMGTSGPVRAFTDNPMIIHPQFESENLRKRVQTAYELYHCGSEASFAETVQSLHADVVIFEYHRCFFTPYTLNDPAKNCDKNRGHRSPDDLLCYKLHLPTTEYFELIFANGGYAVFALKKNGDAALPVIADPRFQDVPMAMRWKHFIEKCAREQGKECPGRLGELAATWHHDIKKQGEAKVLRTLARERFPDDPTLAYIEGRYLDYDVQNPDKAGPLYAQAASGLPSNPHVLREYLMWLDLSAKDMRTIRKLLEEHRKEWLQLRNVPGAAHLYCEAAVSAQSLNLKEFSRKLWKTAVELAPLSKCVQTNWASIETDKSYDKIYTPWHKAQLLGSTGTMHTIDSHNSPGIRFTEVGRFLLLPNQTRA